MTTNEAMLTTVERIEAALERSEPNPADGDDRAAAAAALAKLRRKIESETRQPSG